MPTSSPSRTLRSTPQPPWQARQTLLRTSTVGLIDHTSVPMAAIATQQDRRARGSSFIREPDQHLAIVLQDVVRAQEQRVQTRQILDDRRDDLFEGELAA